MAWQSLRASTLKLPAHAQALGPQLAAVLAELGEAERDRAEHLQLYASFQYVPRVSGLCSASHMS